MGFPKKSFETSSEGNIQVQNVRLESCTEIGGSPFPTYHDSDHHERQCERLTELSWNNIISNQEASLLSTRAIVKIKYKKTVIRITTNAGAVLANFIGLTPDQNKNVRRMPREQLIFIGQLPKDASEVIDQLFHELTHTEDIRWNPTQDMWTDLETLNPLEKRTYNEIFKLRTVKKLNPTTSDEQRKTFLSRFNWDTSQFSTNEQQWIEQANVKYHQIIERYLVLPLNLKLG